MARHTDTPARESDQACVSLPLLLGDLLGVLHLQAKEIERLTTHVEQQTKCLVPASQMSTVVSEISELRNRLREHSATITSTAQEASLAHQRLPFKDMDPLC